jgi:L-serine/L-threonine ammonia-lyase
MLLRLILLAAIGTMLQSRRCFTSASAPAWTAAKRAGFFIESPIIKVKSPEPTIDVYYKMDFLQPSGSFKDRGIGTMIKTLMDRGPTSKLICSSGGNAGHAVATVGEKVGVPVDVFVPVTTMPMMVEKLKARGANVIVSGENWNAADKLAREALAADPSAHYIPPYDSPFIWEGNESIVDEVKAHFESRGEALPDLIILSVGGGGMLRGVQQGIKRLGLEENVRYQ